MIKRHGHKQLKKERVWFGLQFQRVRVYCGREGMAAGIGAGGSQFYSHTEADGKNNKWSIIINAKPTHLSDVLTPAGLHLRQIP